MGKNDMDSGNENDNEKIEINPTTGKPIERRKIEIKFIQNKTKRHVTFSKRKHGIMKKAYELSVLTGTQVLLLVVSETGLVYTFTTPKFQPIVTQPEGKNLIQACLNAPDEEDEEDDEEEDGDDENENENENDENENEAMEEEEEEEEIDGEIGDEDGEVENNNGEEGEPESGEMGQDVHGVNMGVTNAIRKRNMIQQDPNAMVDTSLHNEGDNDNDNDINNNNNGVENGNHNLGKTSKRRKTTDHSMSKNNDGTGQLNHSIPQHYQQQQQQQQQQQYLAQQQQHPNIGLSYSTYNARGTAQ